MKLSNEPTRKIEKRTWVEKVTDDTNSWLLARNLERDDVFQDAASYYLKDASEQRDKNPLRTALSMSSAARCFAELGKNQRSYELFLEAMALYESVKESQYEQQDWDWLTERIRYCKREAFKAKNHKGSKDDFRG
ncbi:MAG: hypothetical protein JSV09_12410 [Thermoplasmata archaeon]|nr:MAG: hypothetical protein JSV09_12410 [Thermoplasmata archaeon]